MSCPAVALATALTSQSLSTAALSAVVAAVPAIGSIIQSPTDLDAILDGRFSQLTLYASYKTRLLSIYSTFTDHNRFYSEFHAVVPRGGTVNLMQMANLGASLYCSQQDLVDNVAQYADPTEVVAGFSSVTSQMTAISDRLMNAAVIPGTPVYPLTVDQPGGYASSDLAGIEADVNSYITGVETSQAVISSTIAATTSKFNEILSLQTALASVSNLRSTLNGNAAPIVSNLVPASVKNLIG